MKKGTFPNSLWTFRKSKKNFCFFTVFWGDLEGAAPHSQATSRSPALLGLSSLCRQSKLWNKTISFPSLNQEDNHDGKENEGAGHQGDLIQVSPLQCSRHEWWLLSIDTAKNNNSSSQPCDTFTEQSRNSKVSSRDFRECKDASTGVQYPVLILVTLN